MTGQENIPTEIFQINDERKHLEGLLKDRINFHLLFASVFMAGLSTIHDPKMQVWALGFITVISLMIALAVFRTFLLVRRALIEIRNSIPQPPYGRYHDAVWFKPNANDILLGVPFILTVAFLMATVSYWLRSSGSTSDAIPHFNPAVVYQIEDHSDRRSVTGAEGAAPAKKQTKKARAQPH
jgi:hypothetical protein